MDALLDFLTINRQAEWRAAVKKQITRHEIEQRHSYAGYFGADYVLAEREHGKPGSTTATMSGKRRKRMVLDCMSSSFSNVSFNALYFRATS